MLDALAYLPLTDVTEGMQYIRQNIPTGDGLEALLDLVDCFDATYVTGSARRVQRPANSHRIQPLRRASSPVVVDARGGAATGRSTGNKGDRAGGPGTAASQGGQALDTAAAVATSVTLCLARRDN